MGSGSGVAVPAAEARLAVLTSVPVADDFKVTTSVKVTVSPTGTSTRSALKTV